MLQSAVVCFFLALSSAQVEELTLDQAIDTALRSNRLVKNAELEVRKMGDEVAATRTYRWPSFHFDLLESQLITRPSFEFPRGAWGVYSATGPIPGKNIPITTPRRPVTFLYARISQPLSQLYRIGLAVRLRELVREEAREKLNEQRESVRNAVKKAYYGLLENQSASNLAEEALKLYKELDRVVSEDVLQQVALKSEGMEVKARLAKAEQDCVTLRRALAVQKEQLNTLMGRDIHTDFRVAALPESMPSLADAAEARARALEQRPELREARLKIRQAEYDRNIKKAEFIPEVSLNFNYLSSYNIDVFPRNIAGGGVLLSWDVFDWGRKKRELAVKEKTVEQAKNGLEEAQAQVLLDVDNRYRNLEEVRALIGVVRLAQEAAREKVRVAMNKYGQHAALLKDVLQTETMLSETNHQYQKALLAFWSAQADFERVVGGQ